jgi:hypothetical protein
VIYLNKSEVKAINSQNDREIHDLFDLTFKQLLTLSHPVIVMTINGLFDTDYELVSKVDFPNAELVNENLDKLIPDTIIRINDTDRYLFEAEISPDKPIALKIFREAFEDAFRNRLEDDIIRLRFPDVRVIYFEPNERTPDLVTVRIETQDGKYLDYPVQSFKPLNYSLRELSEKNLELFLPFSLLKFRKPLEKAKTSEQRTTIIDELRKLLREISASVELSVAKGVMDDRDVYKLLNRIEVMFEQFYNNYPELKEDIDMTVTNPILSKYEIQTAEEVKRAEQRAEQERRMTIINLRQRKMSDDDIASIINIPVERVREIRE